RIVRIEDRDPGRPVITAGIALDQRAVRVAVNHDPMLVPIRLIVCYHQMVTLDRADYAMIAVVTECVARNRQIVRVVVWVEAILKIVRKRVAAPAHTVAAEGVAAKVVMVEGAAARAAEHI